MDASRFFILFVCIASSAALADVTDEDSWDESHAVVSFVDEKATSATESMVQAQTSAWADEQAQVAMSQLEEHIINISEDDLREIATRNAHKSGLIDSKFAQEEIEAQVKDCDKILQAIKAYITQVKDWAITGAVIAAAFILDLVQTLYGALLTAAEAVALKFTTKEEFQKHIMEGLSSATTVIQNAVCKGLTQFLIWAATASGGGATAVSIMKAIDGVGAAIGEVAATISSKAKDVAIQTTNLQSVWPGWAPDMRSLMPDILSIVQDKVKEANLENMLQQALCKQLTPVFCANARKMGIQTLRTSGILEDAAKSKLGVKAGKMLVLISNYLPDCVTYRLAQCKTRAEMGGGAAVAAACDKTDGPQMYIKADLSDIGNY